MLFVLLCLVLWFPAVVFVPCTASSSVPPLSAELQALLTSAAVLLNFSQPMPNHRGTWLPPPSGAADAGILHFDDDDHFLDLGPHTATPHSTQHRAAERHVAERKSTAPRTNAKRSAHRRDMVCFVLFACVFALRVCLRVRLLGDASNYFPWQSRFPASDGDSHQWYLPIASSCNPASGPPCPVSPTTGVVTSGWSASIWVSLRSFAGSAAHLLSAGGNGYSLRLSVDATTRRVELVSDGAEKQMCVGVQPLPLYAWTLISVTQLNNSASAWKSAPTLLYVNGVLDKICSGPSNLMPYWGNTEESKANIYIGLDPLVATTDVLKAQLAMWSFFYYPLTAAQHAAIAAELPLAISGPLQIVVTPPLESGTPLLDTTPRVYSILPQTAVRGTSTFTMCLRSSQNNLGASPACLSWTSSSALEAKTISLTNAQKGPIRFWWESTFVGTNLPGNHTLEYWRSLFVLPPNMTFNSDVPYAQLWNTTGAWATDFTSSTVLPTPTATVVPWLRMGGGLPGTGIAYLNAFHGNAMLDIMTPQQLADVGVTAPPPDKLNPRGLGWTWAMWFNISGLGNMPSIVTRVPSTIYAVCIHTHTHTQLHGRRIF
jgi:hypothetical protein